MDDSGVQDAAVLLLAIGEEAASSVFQKLTPREVESLGRMMATMTGVAGGRLDEVLVKFQQSAGQTTTLVQDNVNYVRGVLNRAIGEGNANSLMTRIVTRPELPAIDNLNWLDATAVAELLQAEHPQVVALILAHLDGHLAGAVIAKLDQQLRNDVLFRLAKLGAITPSAVRELDDLLARLMARRPEAGGGPINGVKTAAELLNKLGAPDDREVLDAIRDQDEELANAISDQMFIFADLARLDDKAIQTLLREVQTDTLVVALKGADQELAARIFKNMSQRAAETLREDLESKGPVRLSEVEQQQREILSAMRRLAEEGQLQLPGGGGDAFV